MKKVYFQSKSLVQLGSCAYRQSPYLSKSSCAAPEHLFAVIPVQIRPNCNLFEPSSFALCPQVFPHAFIQAQNLPQILTLHWRISAQGCSAPSQPSGKVESLSSRYKRNPDVMADHFQRTGFGDLDPELQILPALLTGGHTLHQILFELSSPGSLLIRSAEPITLDTGKLGTVRVHVVHGRVAVSNLQCAREPPIAKTT